MDATQKLINSMKSKPEVRTPIATEMYLPNHSGDHSAGIVNSVPTADNDIVNKKYVDDNFLSSTTVLSKVLVTKNNNQEIPNDTTTIIQYDDVVYDTLGEYDNTNYRFTAKQAGYYLITASNTINSLFWNLGDYIMIRIYKNSSLFKSLYKYFFSATNNTGWYLQGSSTVYLEIGDFIDIRMLQESGGNIYTSTSTTDNYLQITRLI